MQLSRFVILAVGVFGASAAAAQHGAGSQSAQMAQSAPEGHDNAHAYGQYARVATDGGKGAAKGKGGSQ
ncbi:hypothetical protein MFIFM68171_06764 [Madurella fahalii]|uniref:Uncharacterized protein n=1 Tax=Madurella fahalii TaxID=1157608 RepID=A0ABQ0GFL2_9PEZI